MSLTFKCNKIKPLPVKPEPAGKKLYLHEGLLLLLLLLSLLPALVMSNHHDNLGSMSRKMPPQPSYLVVALPEI